MKYGLIGEHLSHSFSKAIHEQIGGYVYEIKEIEPDKVEEFIKAKDFLGINVTIPYKEKVIPYLDYVDENAKKIGAVNTVVNRGGKLYGYNTDFSGMLALVKKVGVEIKDKKVLIIGTGGTSKTATAVVNSLGAKEVIYVSNLDLEGVYTYDQIYKDHLDTQVIFNTSPVGMYPKNENTPIDLERFTSLEGVIDVVYNPIKTKLVLKAQKMGLKSEGGLYMLGAQAVYAYEHFSGKSVDKSMCDRVYSSVLKGKDNIVLIGMPACGKSSVGKALATLCGKKLIDTDSEIVRVAEMDIPSIFEKMGEEKFRELEAQVIKEVSKQNGVIIATGGGAILRKDNVEALKQNANLYFIDRSLELLMPTEDRPLGSTKEAIKQRYEERYPIYNSVCDVRIDGDDTVFNVAEKIFQEWKK